MGGNGQSVARLRRGSQRGLAADRLGRADLSGSIASPAGLQKKLSGALDAACLEADLVACTLSEKAQLRSETLPGAGDFLCTVPSVALRLAMRPAEFRVEFRRRCLVDITRPGDTCPFCGAAMDSRGDHALLCTAGGDRTR